MTHWKSKWFPQLVAVFPLLFPLYLYKGSFFGVPVTLVELSLAVLFLLFVLTEQIWDPKWWSRYLRHWNLWPLFLFFVAAAFSVTLVSGDKVWLDGTVFEAETRAWGIMKGWIVAPMVYFFIARHYFLQRPSLVQTAMDSMLWGGVVLAGMAIQQELTGEFLTLDGRASGPFESANYLSLYLGPLLVYGVLQSFQKGDWDVVKTLRAVGTIVLAVGLMFTESYAAWIAVASAIGLWGLMSFKSLSKKWQSILLGAFLASGMVLIASQLGSEKFIQFLEFSERSSSSVRLEVYEISLNLIQSHPLFGLGLGQFEWFYQTQAVELLGHAPFEWVMLHPHNVFLTFWLNMGLLGLGVFVWLCFKALAWLFEKDKKGRRIVAYCLVSVLVHGLFDTPYFKNDLAFQFWLFMAILL